MWFQVENDVKKRDLLQLLEKYENTNELALATTAGMGFIVRMWVKQGKDYLVRPLLYRSAFCLRIASILNQLAW